MTSMEIVYLVQYMLILHNVAIQNGDGAGWSENLKPKYIIIIKKNINTKKIKILLRKGLRKK